MGREVRRVSADWKHPRTAAEEYIPLHDDFNKQVQEWDIEKKMWDDGYVHDYSKGLDGDHWKLRTSLSSEIFEEWNGERPIKGEYMPAWPKESRTHYQMYETCTEGTPISPVFEDPEKLARWLADTGASAFADMTATYEQWLNTIVRDGWAPSAVSRNGKLESGVAALTVHDE